MKNVSQNVKDKRTIINNTKVAPYMFILPAFVLLVMFNIYPLISSFYVSMLDMKVSFDTAKFVGLANFKEIFSDKRFFNSLYVTILFTSIEVPTQMIIGLIMSEILKENTFWKKLFRSIYFIPVVCSSTAIGIMFQIILHSNIGIVPYWLRILGFGKLNLLNTPGLTLIVVILVSVWRSFGISTIILIGAMQNVPISYYEASQLDGAGRVRQFFSITLPNIMPSFWFLLMTRVIGSLQVFDLIFMLTEGGPNHTTETLVTYVYERAFDLGNRMGYATAMSEFLFLIIMVITVIQYIIMVKTEN